MIDISTSDSLLLSLSDIGNNSRDNLVLISNGFGDVEGFFILRRFSDHFMVTKVNNSNNNDVHSLSLPIFAKILQKKKKKIIYILCARILDQKMR